MSLDETDKLLRDGAPIGFRTMTIKERIKEALQRIRDGRAYMRIPADQTDPDIVLADCLTILEREATRPEALLPTQIIDPPGAAVETFRRRHGRLPTKPGDHLPLLDRLELAAQACHAAHLLSCEATCREAMATLSPLAMPSKEKS